MNRALLLVAVGLLALIWLELGGEARLSGLWYSTTRAVRNIGKAEEGPAPAVPGQRSGLIGGDATDAEIARRLKEWQASAPGR